MPRLGLIAVIFGLLAAPASAATLGEIPPLDLRGDEDCAGPTGAPGELIVDTKTGVRFVTATREGFQFGQALDLGGNFDCAAVVVRPNGAGVLAGEVNGAVVAVVRDPGGAWSAPIKLTTEVGNNYSLGVAADVSDRGDVIVAFKETRFGDSEASQFHVARRPPGGAFGPTEQVGPSSDRLGEIWPAVADTGEAFLATTTFEGSKPPLRVPVAVRLAPAGGAFGAPVPIADTRVLASPALDVAPDGRALIAVAAGTSIVVAERAPGAGFGAATPVGSAGDSALVSTSVVLGPGGSAAVAWRRVFPADAQVVTRPTPGAFTAPVVYNDDSPLPAGYDPFYISESYLASLFGDFGGFSSTGEAPLALTPDGRVLLPGLDEAKPIVTTVALAGGAAVATATNRIFEPSSEVAPMVLADGTPAVVWTQSPTGVFGGALSGSERYRLHLAAEGITERPDPPAPRVTVGAPGSRTVTTEPVALPITCSAACEVYASIDSTITTVGGAVQLTRAGHRTLHIGGAALATPERLGPVRIKLSYGSPGALHPVERTVKVRLQRAKDVTLPRVSAVKARRAGNRIRVTFRVADASDEYTLFVSGDDTRGWSGEPTVTRTVKAKKGKREYSITLPASEGLRYVTVRLPFFLSGLSKTVVRVG